MILLDADVVVDVLRRYPPALLWLESLEEERVTLPGFVVMELMRGCGDRFEMDALRETLRPDGIV
jgi:predicted nucleic acid-binding protein